MLFLMLRGVAHPSFVRPPPSYPGTVGLILGLTPLHAYYGHGDECWNAPPHPLSRGRPLPPPSRSCELTGVALQNNRQPEIPRRAKGPI